MTPDYTYYANRLEAESHDIRKVIFRLRRKFANGKGLDADDLLLTTEHARTLLCICENMADMMDQTEEEESA